MTADRVVAILELLEQRSGREADPAALCEVAAEITGLTGAGIALFLSPWPETWSYTLSEALDEGLLPQKQMVGGEEISSGLRVSRLDNAMPNLVIVSPTAYHLA